MLELLSPAGSPESVIAAVQNGADAVYMGLGNFNARRSATNFDDEEFAKAVRYCRVRDCKVYVTMNTLVNDRELDDAVKLAARVSELGASAILVQDLGFASILRRALPDIPLHASTQMSIHSLAGVEAAAQMGLTRAVLARELSLEQIKYIAKNAPIETEIFVHGALCFCHSGQCYMSSLIGRRSGNRGMCAQPCRMEYSMSGRMADDHPLSLKDNCLIDRLAEIEDAGVACAKIEGRMKRAEYTGLVTGIYSSVIKQHRAPTSEELDALHEVFSRQGFTQGYFDGSKKDMFGTRDESDKGKERFFADIRRKYSGTELRRVPVSFFSVARLGERVCFGAEDADGNRVSVYGDPPQKGISMTTSAEDVERQLSKTGGTPYSFVSSHCRIDDNAFMPAATLNDLRRRLLSELTEKRAQPPQRRREPVPAMPQNIVKTSEPLTVCQLRTVSQLSPELLELRPAYIYLPVFELSGHPEVIGTITDAGVTPVAVLPRVITDDQEKAVADALKELSALGVKEALLGNIGHIKLARQAGFSVRADFGMNVFNSYTLDMTRRMGFLSATASFELRMAQVRDMAKSMDTELIVYGRLPLMVSDQCVISRSEGKCNCGQPAQLSDRMGSVFPVVREFEHRNVIYNSKKLWLTDKLDDVRSAGLWAMRLMFTTESARECVEILKSYKGLGSYKPNDNTNGLYYRGVE